MLVSKNYDAGTIVSMKLVNGDELVAKLVAETADTYTVIGPMTVIPTQKGVQLMQSMFTVEPDQEFSISKQHIMLSRASADPVADHYRELTTGIKTVRNESRIIM